MSLSLFAFGLSYSIAFVMTSSQCGLWCRIKPEDQMPEQDDLRRMLDRIRAASSRAIDTPPEARVRLSMVHQVLEKLASLQRSEKDSDRSADER